MNEDKNSFVDIDDIVDEIEHTGEFLDGNTIIVDVLVGSKGERTRL